MPPLTIGIQKQDYNGLDLSCAPLHDNYSCGISFTDEIFVWDTECEQQNITCERILLTCMFSIEWKVHIHPSVPLIFKIFDHVTWTPDLNLSRFTEQVSAGRLDEKGLDLFFFINLVISPILNKKN